MVAQVVGIDISPEMLERAQTSKVSDEIFEQKDVRYLDFPDSSFDKVTARMVFHHLIEDIRQGAKECYRILKPGGKFILSEGVPPHRALADWYSQMFALKEERLTFFEEDLLDLMQRADFMVEQVVSHISHQVSIGNWLGNSGLPPETQAQIMQMHLQLDDAGKRSYNMTITADNIFCDFKYLILVGVKVTPQIF